MNAHSELDCTLHAWVLLKLLHDCSKEAANGNWFDSPFDSDAPDIIGFKGKKLINAWLEIERKGLVAWEQSEDSDKPHLVKITFKGLSLINKMQQFYIDTIDKRKTVNPFMLIEPRSVELS